MNNPLAFVSIQPRTSDINVHSPSTQNNSRALRQDRAESRHLVLGSLILTSDIIDDLSKEMLDRLTCISNGNALSCLNTCDLESEEEFGVLDGETAAGGAECYLCSMRQ